MVVGGIIIVREKGHNNRYLEYKEVYHGEKHCLDRRGGVVDGFPRWTYSPGYSEHADSFDPESYVVRVHINTLRMAACFGYHESCQVYTEESYRNINRQTRLRKVEKLILGSE